MSALTHFYVYGKAYMVEEAAKLPTNEAPQMMCRGEMRPETPPSIALCNRKKEGIYGVSRLTGLEAAKPPRLLPIHHTIGRVGPFCRESQLG
jgi:hypothetical protein